MIQVEVEQEQGLGLQDKSQAPLGVLLLMINTISQYHCTTTLCAAVSVCNLESLISRFRAMHGAEATG